MNTTYNPVTHQKAEGMVKNALSVFCSSTFYNTYGIKHIVRNKQGELVKTISDKITPNTPVTILISNRMFSCAGQCRAVRVGGNVKSVHIKLNARLLCRVTDEEQYNTVTHELAHGIDYLIRNDSDHKSFWKGVHRAMGGSAERCHNFDTTKLRRTQPLHFIKDRRTGNKLKVKTRTANKVRYSPGVYLNRYEYVGLVESSS